MPTVWGPEDGAYDQRRVENWPDVLRALDEVGYKDIATGGPGWATAEVDAGNREHLADVAARMDKVLGMA